MGTRSLTILNDERSHEIAVMYRQYDGYPEGHGAELVDFLKTMLQPREKREDGFNDSHCLAARLLAHFKTEWGNIYLFPAGTRDCGEEYIYIVTPRGGRCIDLQVFSCYGNKRLMFAGPAQEWTLK